MYRSFWEIREQSWRVLTQSVREFQDVIEAHVSFASLDTADIGGMQPRPGR
jgi:hypothetical protein